MQTLPEAQTGAATVPPEPLATQIEESCDLCGDPFEIFAAAHPNDCEVICTGCGLAFVA
jgi:hypothetical protein